MRPDLTSANLRGANLSGMDLSGSLLSLADLRKANLAGASLKDCNLPRANLEAADLSGTNCQKANFAGAWLLRANLSGAVLRMANLAGANLAGKVDLSGADLTGANFAGAKLIGVNFSGATLVGANLAGTDAREANFTGADLTDAVTAGARLDNANMAGAVIRQTMKRPEIAEDGLDQAEEPALPEDVSIAAPAPPEQWDAGGGEREENEVLSLDEHPEPESIGFMAGDEVEPDIEPEAEADIAETTFDPLSEFDETVGADADAPLEETDPFEEMEVSEAEEPAEEEEPDEETPTVDLSADEIEEFAAAPAVGAEEPVDQEVMDSRVFRYETKDMAILALYSDQVGRKTKAEKAMLLDLLVQYNKNYFGQDARVPMTVSGNAVLAGFENPTDALQCGGRYIKMLRDMHVESYVAINSGTATVRVDTEGDENDELIANSVSPAARLMPVGTVGEVLVLEDLYSNPMTKTDLFTFERVARKWKAAHDLTGDGVDVICYSVSTK